MTSGGETPVQSLDYVKILRGVWRRQKRILLGLFVALAAPLLIVVYYTTPPLYVSSATLAVERPPMDLIPQVRDVSNKDMSNNLATKKDTVSTLLIHLRSRSLSAAVADVLPTQSLQELDMNPQYTDYVLLLSNTLKSWLGRPPTILIPKQRAVAELQKARMDFRASGDPAGVFHIEATASGPRAAVDLVSTYIHVLTGRSRVADVEDARKVREFLEAQSEQVKESVVKAEENLMKFQAGKGRVKFAAQNESDVLRLSQLENALAEAQASREVVSARIAKLRQSLNQPRIEERGRSPEKQGKEESAATPDQPGTQPKFISFKLAQERLAGLKAKLVDLRERYTEAHPLIQKTEQEVTYYQALVAQLARDLPTSEKGGEETQKQLAELVSEDSTLQAKVDSASIQLNRLRSNLRTFGEDEIRFRNLQRTVDMNRNLLAILTDKLMAARIREQGDLGLFRIIDPPSFPSDPTRSRTYKLMLAIIALSSGVAFGLALAIELWTLPIDTESDVQRTTGLPVLGSVGIIQAQRNGRNRERSRTPGTSSLPIYLQGSSETVRVNIELYRAIRAAVETERMRSGFRSIMICSAWPAEGKSSAIINLAHAFQEFGRRVLMIDGDLRRPSLHKALAVGNKPGIVDFLVNNATLESVCRRLPSGVTVVPGQVAKQDVGALFASARAKELLKFGAEFFDLVIYDSAPILAVPDNLLLPTQVDRVIIVVKSTSTSTRDFQKVHALLERRNASILGVILNQVERRAIDYYHPRYRKYYTTKDTGAKLEA
jgi:capsular exopolysaccharide synthesis family protein